MFIINNFSTCFRHHYAHLQENKTCVTARGVLGWFCGMWLVAVVGRCVVGCEHCEGYCSHPTTQRPTTATNHIQQNQRSTPHVFVVLKMGIMMPETCRDTVDNKHLTVESCWFSLSLHNDVNHKTTNAVILWDFKSNSELKFKNIFMKSWRFAVLFFLRGV